MDRDPCRSLLEALAAGLLARGFAVSARLRKRRMPTADRPRASIWRAAGDCIACHTAPRRQDSSPAACAMPTPFGTLYTSNITPDPQTGIGTWTSDEFYKMMHNGRFPDGGLVYPAMPFASYTKVTREDSDAIYAYLALDPAGEAASTGRSDLQLPLQQPLADPRLAHAVLQARASTSRCRPNRRSGIAAPIWSKASAIAACATPRSTRSAAARIAGLRGRADPDAELVRAVADLQQGSRPRRLEHRGDHPIYLQRRRLRARRGLRADGRGRL